MAVSSLIPSSGLRPRIEGTLEGRQNRPPARVTNLPLHPALLGWQLLHRSDPASAGRARGRAQQWSDQGLYAQPPAGRVGVEPGVSMDDRRDCGRAPHQGLVALQENRAHSGRLGRPAPCREEGFRQESPWSRIAGPSTRYGTALRYAAKRLLRVRLSVIPPLFSLITSGPKPRIESLP